ncbi:cysteine--tRNA ligase, partial [Vibrio parahaemolyticus V-223/04]
LLSVYTLLCVVWI